MCLFHLDFKTLERLNLFFSLLSLEEVKSFFLDKASIKLLSILCFGEACIIVGIEFGLFSIINSNGLLKRHWISIYFYHIDKIELAPPFDFEVSCNSFE